MLKSLALVSALALIAPTVAQAAGAPVTGTVTINSHVAPFCEGGTVTGGDSTFDMGVLIDTSTGLLLTTLSAPPKVVTGSFCNTLSTISVTATPMTAQSFTGAPPSGFTDAVDYTATAAGWTTTPASFVTDAASNPASSQTRDSAFSGPITVSVTNFNSVGGESLRLVADPVYMGVVTVTLAVAS